MALSGRAGTVFTNNGAFELIIEWSANQNIGGNSSTVTAIMKIRGIYSWSTVNDGTASASYISINGNRKNFNANSTVRGGQTKELGRHTVTVPHNANGTKSFNISGNHYFDIYWNGGSPVTPSLSNNYTLNTIPRASTGSGTSFVFTSNSSISISRASSGFTHKARFHVDGTFIKELTGLGTSGTFNFSDAERRSIISKMNGRTSVQCRVDLWTYSGSTQIGSMSQFTYNVTAPARAGATVRDFVISTAGFPVSLTNYNAGAKFTYNVTWSYRTFKKSTNNVGSNFTFVLTQADVDGMLATIPDTNRTWGTLSVESFYDGVKFGSTVDVKDIYATVDTKIYSPEIKGGTTYKDVNSTVVAVTGDSSIVLKQLSIVEVYLPAGLGTAKGGTSMNAIEVSLGGATTSIPYTANATTVTLRNITASTSGNLTVNVIDGRANRATWATPVTILDYKPPTLTPEINRVNNYESSTDVVLGGTYSMVKVGNADKNAISEVTYVFKQTTSTVWSSANKMNFIASNGIISSPPNTRITLDNTYAWDIRITATDKLKVSTMYEYTLAEGVPILFIDSGLKSVGVNRFPDKEDAFQVKGTIDLDGTLTTAKNTYAGTGGAINLWDSDILGVNGIYFNDPADNIGEGLMFPKAGTSMGDNGIVNNLKDYDTFKVLNGVGYLNNVPVFVDTNKPIWTGQVYLNSAQEITLPVPITQCPNGYMLVWSRFENDTAYNDNFCATFIPKRMANMGGGINQDISRLNASETSVKYVYMVGTNKIKGHDNNGTGVRRYHALIEIWVW